MEVYRSPPSNEPLGASQESLSTVGSPSPKRSIRVRPPVLLPNTCDRSCGTGVNGHLEVPSLTGRSNTGVSFNGRTADCYSVHGGSSPPVPANLYPGCEYSLWSKEPSRVRLADRTLDFQSRRRRFKSGTRYHVPVVYRLGYLVLSQESGVRPPVGTPNEDRLVGGRV